jgi:hypothetical protein
MAARDDYGLQSERIIQGIKRLCPHYTVTFDSGRAPEWIRFRIDDGSTMLTKVNPDYRVSEVADWSQEKLYQIIEAVTGGLVRTSA